MGKLQDRLNDTSFVATFLSRPFNVAGNIASILGLVLSAAALFKFDLPFIPLVYVCGLSLFLLIRYLRNERWGRYAEGVQVMERAHRRLKEATDRLLYGSGNSEVFFIGLQESLSAFAEAYTLVTGSNCRASIQEVFADDEQVAPKRRGQPPTTEPVVMAATIVRSDIDASRKTALEAAHRVRDNTDFDHCLRTLRPFHGNNLPRAWVNREYQNTNWTEDLKKTKDYPYRSAIVWPIEVDPPMGGEPVEGVDRVIAFLSVDTRRRGAFFRRPDTTFGGAYAHALYPGLRYALVGEGTQLRA